VNLLSLSVLTGVQGDPYPAWLAYRRSRDDGNEARDRQSYARFAGFLNELSRALTDFTATYKSGQVDLKKVKAVRKALHELEKSEWFRPQKAK
jgi:hypothetical protein